MFCEFEFIKLSSGLLKCIENCHFVIETEKQNAFALNFLQNSILLSMW